jgi:hypothetical protein
MEEDLNQMSSVHIPCKSKTIRINSLSRSHLLSGPLIIKHKVINKLNVRSLIIYNLVKLFPEHLLLFNWELTTVFPHVE